MASREQSSKRTATGSARYPRVMTVPEAGAHFFGLSRGSAYKAARRGDLPALRFGRRLLVPVEACEALLRRHVHLDALDADADERRSDKGDA